MYFLNELTENPNIAGREAPAGISGFVSGAGAAVEAQWLEFGGNFRVSRDTEDSNHAIAIRAIEVLGSEGVQAATGKPWTEAEIQRFLALDENSQKLALGRNARASLIEAARVNAAENPDAWEGVPLTDEAIQEQINADIQAEHQDALDTMDMMPSGRGAAEFLGRMIGSTVNLESTPLLLLGGGSGSLLKVMGREAMINTAIEGAFLPRQFEMAERLNIEDPDILQQLSFAAVAGAGFGGAFEAAARGFRYARARNQVRSPQFNDTALNLFVVDHIENVAARNTLELGAEIARVAESSPDLMREAPPLVTPRETNADIYAPDSIEETALPDAEVQRESVAATEPELGRRPVTSLIIGSGGVNPDSPAGIELKNMGFTSRNAPGLFRKTGRTDLDNIVFGEHGGTIEHIIGSDGHYLDERRIYDLMREELAGNPLREAQSAARARNMDYAPDYRAAQDEFLERAKQADAREGWIAPRSDMDDFDPDFSYDRRKRITDTVDAHIRGSGYGDLLSPAERHEIIETIDAHGGYIDDAIGVFIERETEVLNAKIEDLEARENAPPIEFDDLAPEGAVGDAGPSGAQRDIEPEGQGPRQANDEAVGGSEQTAAGEQFVTPGVQPLTLSDRLAAIQGRPMRGGNAPTDMGLFDLNSRTQTDLFADGIDSPKAKEFIEAREAEIRSDIEANGDAVIDMEDGLGPRKMSEILDDLDGDEDFLNVIEMCGRK